MKQIGRRKYNVNIEKQLEMKMPKICIMSSVHTSNDVRIYHKEIVSLKKAGFDVVFLNKERTGRDDLGVEFIRLEISKKRLKRILTSPFKMYKLAKRQNASAYHFHDPELLLTGLLLSLKGKKVIYDAHEDVSKQILQKKYIPFLLRRIISFLVGDFEKYCSRRFSAVIAATPSIQEEFKKKKCKVICVNNYPLLHEFTDIIERKKERSGVCYVGGITKERGIIEMIEAAYIAGQTLKLCGNFSSELMEYDAKNMAGWKNVEFHGFVSREKIVNVIDSSLAGLVILHPVSQYLESLPIKMFEYMAAGIPVIASNFPLWKSIIGESKCGICVDPLEPAEIANAIEYLKNNKESAQIMGETGRKLIREKYNWGIEERKLIRCYHSLF